jgi:hypothetical protein
MRNPTVPLSFLVLAGVALTGCVRGGAVPNGPPIALDPGEGPISPVTEPPQAPTPTPTPSPAPAPTPTPTPSPPPVVQLPPLSPVLVDLDDNHQVGDLFWPDHDTATGGQGEPVGKYVCWPNWPPETYHVHSHLSIFLDGRALAVPDDIGVVKVAATNTYCYYTLHTHDRSGKLHVEAPAPELYTLGDLFSIWGRPLEPDNVAGLTGKPIVIYITDNNGVVTLATGDWHDIELLSHREITIQVGTPIAEIPNFTWTAH